MALVLDTSLSGPLSLVTDKPFLKERGVEKTFHLGREPIDTEHRQVVYIVRAEVAPMHMIAQHIKRWRSQPKKEVYVYMVPRRTIIAEHALVEQGVWGDVQVGEFNNLDIIPFDDDLLSLELPNAFREVYVDRDRTALYAVARALMKIQSMFGVIPQIRGKGTASRLVADMMVKMRKEAQVDELVLPPEIDQLILIDRECDLVTPLLTELTYEGLIDELYNIQNASVEVSSDIAGTPQHAGRKVRVPLNSNDKLFSELRDLNFTAVGPTLKKKALHLHEVEQERYKLQERAVSQIKDYVKKLKEMNIAQEKTLLGLHTNLAQELRAVVNESTFNKRLEAQFDLLHGKDAKVNDYIEELLYTNEPLTKVLRILCLHSLLFNGLKRLDFYKRELVQTYGYEMMLTLTSLERASLLKRADSALKSNPWSSIKKTFKLLVEDVSELNPQDIAYVYSGYAPLSIRVVQKLLQQKDLKASDEALKLVPGPHFEIEQPQPRGSNPSDGSDGRVRNKVVLVFFLGGCTFTEVSAIRFLAKMDQGQREYLVGTTKLINGDKLLEPLLHKFEPLQRR
jgi:hypothetical protein